MQYRRDIDGLRAVALIPVILFHAGLDGFAGGFIGVDVFFVISGYLITSIILADRAAGRYSTMDFYRRRARRLVPALIAVAACCIPFALMWMMPDQLVAFGKNLIAVALFGSNILLWQETDYFAPASELNPLLHIWSLAVEGQFYLLFPALFLIRRDSQRGLVIAGLAAVSLIASQIVSGISPEGNFFLLSTRAWELLAGALIASLPLGTAGTSRAPLPALGLAMIAVSMFIFDSRTPWPSLFTLLPVVGTCLVIIAANEKQGVGRLLASPALVGIGVISYSTYLWHQPLFAFARLRSLTEPSLALMLALAVLSLAIGWLSWRYVEQPFRRMPAVSPPGTRTGLAVGGWAALAVAGASLWLSAGLPGRPTPEALAFYRQADDVSPYRNICQFKLGQDAAAAPDLPLKGCVFGPGATPNVALIGDSHAGAVASTFAEALAGMGVTSTEIVVPGCVPFPGYRRATKDCDRKNTEIFSYLLSGTIDTVVLIGRYSSVLKSERFDNGEGGIEPRDVAYDKKTFSFALPPGASSEDYAIEMFRRGITSLLDAGLKVILVYPIPEAGWNVPDLLTKRAMFAGATADLSTAYAAYLERYGKLIALFDSIESPRLARLRPADVLCKGGADIGRCQNSSGGVIFYHDHNHPTQAGARLLAPAVLKAWHDLPPQ